MRLEIKGQYFDDVDERRVFSQKLSPGEVSVLETP